MCAFCVYGLQACFSPETFPKARWGRRVRFLIGKTPNEIELYPIIAEGLSAVQQFVGTRGKLAFRKWEGFLMGSLNIDIMVK